MPTWIFTVTPRPGQSVDGLYPGEPLEAHLVYDQAELDRLIAAAKNDPRDLRIEAQQIA